MFARLVSVPATEDTGLCDAFESWRQSLPGQPGQTDRTVTTAAVVDAETIVGLVATTSSDPVVIDYLKQPWWTADGLVLPGEPAVCDSTDVVLVELSGSLDEATFVVIMQGRYRDPDQAKSLLIGNDEEWAAFAPHLLGSITAYHGDGDYFLAMYYTSESEVYAAEFDQPPPHLEAVMSQSVA